MINTKQLVLTAAAGAVALASVATYAGSTEAMAAPATANAKKVYVEAGMGYARTNAQDNQTFRRQPSAISNKDNANGGMMYAADAGYQLNDHLAAEIGFGILPTAKFTHTVTATDTDYKVSSWYSYAAGRVSAPVMNKVDVFGKAGVAYRRYKTEQATTTTDSYWTALMGAGVNYQINDKISTTVEYDVIPGTADSKEGNNIDAAHIFMGKIGYQISL